jgi:hypothetical protein
VAGDGLRKHVLRQTEVENLGVPSLRDENVGRLDVAMNDAFAVSSIERIDNLDGNGDNGSASGPLPLSGISALHHPGTPWR